MTQLSQAFGQVLGVDKKGPEQRSNPSCTFRWRRARSHFKAETKDAPDQTEAEAEETWQKEMIQIVQSQKLMTGSKGLHVKPSLFAEDIHPTRGYAKVGSWRGLGGFAEEDSHPQN